MNNEFYRSSVGASSCSYANLCQYNYGSCTSDGQGPRGAMAAHALGAMPPIPSTTRAVQVVPSFGTFGYQTACSGRSSNTSCNGYFSINNAYPDYNACSQFSTRLCSGSNSN